MGTSGRCGKFILDDADDDSEKIDFDKKEMQQVYDELNTTDSSDLITLGSPQLGLEELSDLSSMLKGKSFKKRCMVFCPRTIQNQAKKLGYTGELERAGYGVTTNSIKGAYYLKNSNGVDVNLKPLSKIIQEETK
jgi:predicted aconitase